MSMNALHITNGDSVLYSWKKAGLLGTHLAWRDVLHEGPVPAGLTLEELSRVRADYLSRRGYGSGIKIHRDFEKRDAAVREAAKYDEIVLWFEHDLYDQLHILQILHTLRTMGLGAGRVELVQSDQYLGTLSPDELLALYPKRRFVADATEQAAAKAWEAFTSEDASAIAAASRAQFPGLPFMRAAFYRLCEEFPAAQTGLSRSQKALLDACSQGARSKQELFKRSAAREEAAFMGDSACFAALDDLCAPPAPLLEATDFGYDTTVLGRRVFAGDADWLAHQPLDRWIGGAHLRTESHLRWDDRQETLVSCRSSLET